MAACWRRKRRSAASLAFLLLCSSDAMGTFVSFRHTIAQAPRICGLDAVGPSASEPAGLEEGSVVRAEDMVALVIAKQ
eukprot:s354_g16.t1